MNVLRYNPPKTASTKIQLEEQLADIWLLHNLSLQLIEEDITYFYEKIIETAMAIMQADFANIQMYYPERGEQGELRLLAHRGFNKEAVRLWDWVSPSSKSCCGIALKTGKRYIITDIENSDILIGTEDKQTYSMLGIRAVQTTPLFCRKGKLVGMLSTHWNTPHEPTEYDFQILDMLARQAADVIEHKRSEDELRHSEEFKRRIIESTQDCIKVLDLDGRLLSMNDPGKAGLEIDDITPFLNLPWADFWDEKDRDRARSAVIAAASGGIGRFEGYLPTLKSNSPKWWQAILTPITDGNGKPIQLLAVSRDITEIKKYEQVLQDVAQQAQEANQAKSDFLANMSHEIRTPMNAVIGLTQILSRSTNLSAREKEYVSTLQTSAEQLMTLINDMLDVSKIESNAMELEEMAFKPFQLLEDCLAVASVSAQQKNLMVVSEIQLDTGFELRGDPLRIRQIVLNLLSNAVKFTDEGHVKLKASCKTGENTFDAELVIRIQDTGIGMGEEIVSKLFDKFTQEDSSITRRYGGSGLGLAISKKLAELMGGNITVHSEKGTGTEFTITLPLTIPRQSHFNLEQNPMQRAQNQKLRILLVEDYPANILVATTILGQFGHDCTVAQSGQEAIQLMETNNFDLVFMDVQMYELDGYETTRIIRSMERREKRQPVPIIAMTAHALIGDKEKCLSAGMNDYISKPFDFEILRSKLAKYMPAGLSAA